MEPPEKAANVQPDRVRQRHEGVVLDAYAVLHVELGEQEHRFRVPASSLAKAPPGSVVSAVWHGRRCSSLVFHGSTGEELRVEVLGEET